jgi:Ca2+-binding RTX toxin-like protein
MGRRARLGLGIVAALALLPAGIARATITVANSNDSGPGSLRQAIADAAPGETIVVPASTYTLSSGQLAIAKSLSIAGAGAEGTIIRSGGGFRVVEVSGAGNSVNMSGVTIRDGFTGPGNSEGGGVFNHDGPVLTLQSVIVTNNQANADGGPGQFGGIATGGGIANENGTLRLLDSKVLSNTASAVGGNGSFGGIAEGGGVASLGPFTIEGSTISGNTADTRGGQGPTDSDQFGGIADGGGFFAVVNDPPGSSLSSTTLNGNLADASEGPGGFAGIAEGGGMFLVTNGPPVALSNATFAANTVRVLGGGIGTGGGLFGNANSSTLTLTSSTLSANAIEGPSSSGSGGNFFTGSGSDTKIANTIISGGVGPAGSENCGSGGESQGFNLDSLDQCGFHAGGDQVNIDPQLGPLASNGGPTQTMALAATSPAVDKGSAFGLIADQRGLARPFDFAAIPNSAAAGGDGADIGAFELAPDCQGRPATIAARPGQTTVGTNGPDVIVGTDGANVINAGAGKDFVCGRSGKDRVAGGKGADRLNGDAGKDRVGGGAGKDTEKGGKGKDRLSGAAGKDRLLGGKGGDRLKGGRGKDTLKGGPGKDKLFGGPQKDKLYGGAGKDSEKQ